MQKLDFQNRETNFWLCRKFAKNQNYPDAFLMSQAVDQNVLYHFLNFGAVTPIAEPAIMKELYFPFKFLFFK